ERAGWIPFFIMHFVMFGAIWHGWSWEGIVVCAVLFFVRMFAVTAGYHRYFAHRTFETSRWFQFVLAWTAVSSIQRGPLWWAAHHRAHHLHSDTEKDLHSPVVDRFWHSHFGWLFAGNAETDHKRVKDFAKYPELVWLDRWHLAPIILLGILIASVFGWSVFFIGWAISNLLVWHCTFLVNSLTHMVGTRRFDTKDESRNSLVIALLTMGEGWHNNHHRYMNSARMGFYPGEIDLTYYGLVVLEKLGLIWNLKQVPERILEEGRRNDANAEA
ncbi:acyl-CoA desaturase, partial [bacterium AH-315-N03]|nr:acyl-CoA desaturase [bacterium AH-315-N03]